MGALFGKRAKSTSSSENVNNQYIKDTFSPMTQYAGTGAEMLQQLLSGDASGFNAYKDATGFDGLIEEGSRGITGNAAAGGLLRSGGTGKALVNYGNMMQNQYADQYLNRALNLSGLGMNAGQLIASTGQTSQSTSKGPKKGLLDYAAAAASSIAGGKGGG